jgi:siroheme synthase (precorrin-2 oxidase/ferrochelatase)
VSGGVLSSFALALMGRSRNRGEKRAEKARKYKAGSDGFCDDYRVRKMRRGKEGDEGKTFFE